MFKKTFLIMIAAEVISLLAFVWKDASLPLLILVFVATLAISLKRLEWGIYILFGELFVGSRGHLLEYGFLSLRLVIFIAVFLAWLVHPVIPRLNRGIQFSIRNWIPDQVRNDKLKVIYLLLLLVIVIGAVYGYARGNGISNVFYDVNGYLYLAILPAVLSVIKTREQVENLFQILGAAIIVIALKTLTLFIWFTYALPGVATAYHWIISQDIGEITGNAGSASRIFMQSQFWALMGLFLFGITPTVLPSPALAGEGGVRNREGEGWRLIILAAAIFSVIMSLSRSFWLGGIAGAIFFAGIWLFYVKGGLQRLTKLAGIILLIAALEIGGVYLLSLGSRGISESIASRGINPTQEAAGGARLLLLPILLDRIKVEPVAGYGFGKTVSYDSLLPDQVNPDNPAGTITSYAFEWGYLDMILKIGAVGLLAYLFFIANIFQQGWNQLSIINNRLSILGMLSGLVALAVLNVTTPYLNHPLGIGYLILAIVSLRFVDPSTSSGGSSRSLTTGIFPERSGAESKGAL